MKIRFKKALALTMAGLMSMALLTGCGGSGTANNSSSTDTKTEPTDKKVLRVGMECAYAPFNWTQTSEDVPNGDKAVKIYGQNTYAYGYDVMVANKLAEKLGMEVEVHKVEWDSIGLGLDSNEYDCIIAGMGKTAVREKSYAFTEPYYYRDNCIVVRADSDIASVTGLSQLAGKNVKITTQLGTGWVDLLDQIPDGVKGSNYETTGEVFLAVSNGVADVAVIDVPTAESALLTNKDLKLITLDEKDTFKNDKEMTNVCIATRKNDTEFRDKLQKAMDDIGWNDKAKMDELMEEAIKNQPAA